MAFRQAFVKISGGPSVWGQLFRMRAFAAWLRLYCRCGQSSRRRSSARLRSRRQPDRVRCRTAASRDEVPPWRLTRLQARRRRGHHRAEFEFNRGIVNAVQPVAVADVKNIPSQRLFRADDDLPFGGVHCDDIERLIVFDMPAADPQAFALADRVMDDALVAAHDPAIEVDDLVA